MFHVGDRLKHKVKSALLLGRRWDIKRIRISQSLIGRNPIDWSFISQTIDIYKFSKKTGKYWKYKAVIHSGYMDKMKNQQVWISLIAVPKLNLHNGFKINDASVKIFANIARHYRIINLAISRLSPRILIEKGLALGQSIIKSLIIIINNK